MDSIDRFKFPLSGINTINPYSRNKLFIKLKVACCMVVPPEFCQTYVQGPLLLPVAVADAVPVAQLILVTFTHEKNVHRARPLGDHS